MLIFYDKTKGVTTLDDIILSIKNINKNFANVAALKDFCVDIRKGEFITILGPSGCGKTTLLRIIAGLEHPDNGSIILDGIDITGYLPEARNVNTVFQNYALFPHMNVYDNISYGLKLKKISKKEIANRVNDILELVQLKGYENRRIHQLSGGQRQRVAIARALILQPKVLLLDEPLGALDHKLRLDMQEELKKMQILSGTTFVYVTHDQDEALNLSDRIILMNNSTIEQIATPNEIYNFPKSLFAAKFIGEANVIKGVYEYGKFNFDLFTSEIVPKETSQIYAVIRPEQIIFSENGVEAEVVKQSKKGGVVFTEVILNSGLKLVMRGFEVPIYTSGFKVKISIKNDAHYIYE